MEVYLAFGISTSPSLLTILRALTVAGMLLCKIHCYTACDKALSNLKIIMVVV